MSSPVCAICGGVESEHVTSAHVFTLNPGELVTKEQQAKEKPPLKVSSPGAGAGPLGRLLEVLTVKGYINLPEVLYISDLGDRPASLSEGTSHGHGS